MSEPVADLKGKNNDSIMSSESDCDCNNEIIRLHQDGKRQE